jgi:hypothetical protein
VEIAKGSQQWHIRFMLWVHELQFDADEALGPVGGVGLSHNGQETTVLAAFGAIDAE